MSYYDAQSPAAWQSSRPAWDARPATTPDHPSPFHGHRSHASDASDLTTRFTAQMKPEDPSAFGSQLDEVDRAVDNLVKSGKMFPTPRRDSMPMLGATTSRGFPLDPHAGEPRMGNPMPVRHYSVPDFDAVRSPSAANLQNFYATQRFQATRGPAPEAETMMQAKRRAAAQRERELRNYHQEQQYNRSISSNPPAFARDPAYKGPLAVLAELSTVGKEPRVMSPSTMNEEDRRDLIARQHRALYAGEAQGSEDGSQLEEASTSRSLQVNTNGTSTASGTRGPSPMSSSFDPFGLQQNGPNGNLESTQGPPTSAAEQFQTGAHSAGGASPHHARTHSGSPPLSATFNLSENSGLNNRTTASSPGGSPPRSQRGSIAHSGVAPIGTRPTSQAQNPSVANAKRTTTPLPSPLSYGFAPDQDPFNNLPKERSASAASTEQHSTNNVQGDGLGWSKVWGPGNKGLNNVASVWG